MITLRREADGVTLVTWGNADEGLQRGNNADATGGGTVRPSMCTGLSPAACPEICPDLVPVDDRCDSLGGACGVRDRLEGGFARRRGYDPAELMRALLGMLDGQVARCGTNVAKSAVPAHPPYVDSEARRGRIVLGR